MIPSSRVCVCVCTLLTLPFPMQACSALAAFAALCDNKLPIVSSGGLEKIVAAMALHLRSVTVQVCPCSSCARSLCDNYAVYAACERRSRLAML